MDPKERLLRLTAGAVLIGVMVTTGVLQRSPWVVALMTPVFTLLYALGKWQAWRLAWRIGGARQIVVAVLTTLPIQGLLAGTFYVLGFGIGALRATREFSALNGPDLIGPAIALLFGAGTLMVNLRSEDVASPAPAPGAPEPELAIDPTPLTPETFFVPHGSAMVGADSAAIQATEARLGVRLPAALRELYRRSNGGFVGNLYVPLKPDPQPRFADWRGAFAIDYSSLSPLESLRSVAEHYADFTDDPDDIPALADRRIVLVARYGDMTLLDYSEHAEPRVLLVNYDNVEDDPVDVAFASFDAFFAALRRGPR